MILRVGVSHFLLRGLGIKRPNHVWCTDIERHEALLNLAAVGSHRHRLAAAKWLKPRAAGAGGYPQLIASQIPVQQWPEVIGEPHIARQSG